MKTYEKVGIMLATIAYLGMPVSIRILVSLGLSIFLYGWGDVE